MCVSEWPGVSHCTEFAPITSGLLHFFRIWSVDARCNFVQRPPRLASQAVRRRTHTSALGDARKQLRNFASNYESEVRGRSPTCHDLGSHAITGLLSTGVVLELDRLAVRCPSIGVGPGILARQQCRPVRQALFYHQALEGGEPTVVVVRTIVRLTSGRARLELLGEGLRPLLPGEVALP